MLKFKTGSADEDSVHLILNRSKNELAHTQNSAEIRREKKKCKPVTHIHDSCTTKFPTVAYLSTRIIVLLFRGAPSQMLFINSTTT